MPGSIFSSAPLVLPRVVRVQGGVLSRRCVVSIGAAVRFRLKNIAAVAVAADAGMGTVCDFAKCIGQRLVNQMHGDIFEGLIPLADCDIDVCLPL